MPHITDYEAVLILLACVAFFVIAPACWYVVRIGSSRTASNLRRVSRQIRQTGHFFLCPGGAIAVAGALTTVVYWLTVDAGQETLVSSAVAGIGLVLTLVSLLMYDVSKRIAWLIDGSNDDREIAVDRQLGSMAFLGWAAVTLSLMLTMLMLPIMLVLLMLILLIALPLTIQLVRARRQCQLLWMIAVTIRSGRGLPAELRNHASCHHGTHAASIRQLAQDLDAGSQLGDALLVAREKVAERSPGIWQFFVSYNPVSILIWFFFGPSLILPAWVIAAVQAGEKIGTLEKTLAATSKQYLDSIRTRFTLSNVTGLTAYLVAYLSIAIGVVSFLMVFIMPKFKAIFDGFGTELPDVSETVIAVSDFAASYWYVFVILGIFPLRLLIRLGIGEPLAWKNLNSKVFAKYFPRLDAPDVLRQLCAVIRTGQPLNAGLRALSETHQRDTARAELLKVLEGIEAGKDCWSLLADAGYLRHEDLQLLRVAINAGNLPWALEELASSRERSLEHRLKVAVSFAEPAIIIAFGLLCGFIIIGFFMPVAKLVNDLS